MAPVAPATPAAPDPITYTYSTGNAFTKSNSKSYFVWRNMVTQLHAHGQWEVVDTLSGAWLEQSLLTVC